VKTSIQIVAFNIPYPPDYGGIIDVFYKIKALHECGVSIDLHCFEYNRPHAKELEKYCAKIFYYSRRNGLRYQFSTAPYITITRANNQLLNNLNSNNAPIIFEGLHCCHFIDDPMLAMHQRLVRTHNIEHEYYQNLAKSESNLYRKLYYKLESFKLKRYDNVLSSANQLLCISPNDNYYFDHCYGNAHFVPAFHPFHEILSKTGRGEYILFHGNLSVVENMQAVDFLLNKVFNKIDKPVIIAGKNPADSLIQKTGRFSHIKLLANPEMNEMENLIRDAQICILPKFQDTGLKLKLLASLFSCRSCISN